MIGTWIAYKLVRFGIWLHEQKPFGMLDEEDKQNLRRLWELHDKYERELNEPTLRT